MTSAAGSASALEHGIIEQLQNTNLVGASTVKMLQIANTNGQPVYLANSGNWSSDSRASLTNYGSGCWTRFTAGSSTKATYVLLPPTEPTMSPGAGSWTGYGYEARQATKRCA